MTTTAPAAFRQSYPIDFGLYNDDEQEILSITDDPAGQSLHLEIKNASAQAITLTAPTDATPGSTNHHFALRFRPATLAPMFQAYLSAAVSTLSGSAPATTLTGAFQAFAADTTAILQGALQKQGWKIGYQQEPAGTIVLYFLSMAAQTLASDAQIVIPLAHASASSTGGAHTTRVELHYQQLTFGGDTTPINGRRQVHLSIVNQSGQKHIPLHASFVGFDTVLNDGQTQNTLTLRITNVQSDSAIALNPANSHVPSKFFLSFDAQADKETKEWALGTTSQVRAIQVMLADPSGWTVSPPTGQEEAPEWTLEAQPARTSLAANEAITLTLANIISSLASGPAHLYIRYENIPGYWDGQLAVTIEKTPLLYRGSNVGMSTASPRFALEIKNKEYQLALTNGQDHNWVLANFSDDRLYFQYREQGNFKNNAMSLDKDGHLTPGFLNVNNTVGIGTTSPHGALEIGPNVVNANAWVYFQGNANGVANPSTDIKQGLMLTWNPSGGQGETQLLYATGLGSTPRLDFGRWNGTAKTIDMTLNGGNLGVGTATPHASLEVKSGDFQLSVTNEQDHNWGLTNWTDDKLYFQYREQGVYKNNAMALDKNGQLTLSSLNMGNNALQQGVNWTTSQIHYHSYPDGPITVAPLTSSNALRIVGGDGGVLATSAADVLCWASYGVVIKGNIWAENKYFRIAHPAKPDHYLIHACLEGPESSVYYRGQAQLTDGRATIVLPDYFEALTRQENRTVLLTPRGREPFLLSADEIVDGQFRVYGTQNDGLFSWEVKAVRSDVAKLEPEIESDRSR